jgi:hypothetical protein
MTKDSNPMFGKNLIPRQSIVGIVQAHDRAKKLAEEGLTKLSEAKAILHETLGTYNDDVFKDQLSRLDIDSSYIHRALEGSADTIKNNCWTYLLKQTGAESFLSSKRKEEAQKQIERNESPDFTVENVLAMIQGMAGNVQGYFEEAVTEVYDWLRPHRGWGDQYKTNIPWEVGRKLIKDCIMTSWTGAISWREMRISHWQADNLRDLDRVFHLLDGKGAPKYPGDLVTKINSAIQENEHTAETDYFKVKWFKKGTMHFEFKRDDLLAEFNRVAGGARLKGPKAA